MKPSSHISVKWALFLENITAFHTAKSISSSSDVTQEFNQPRLGLFLTSRSNNNGGDRFIPRRRGVNFDGSHYYHTHIDQERKDHDHLDVFEEHLIDVYCRHATIIYGHWEAQSQGIRQVVRRSIISRSPQIKNATERWRRKYMDRAFEHLDIFSGLQNKRVLNIAGKAGFETSLRLRDLAGTTAEFNHDCHWPCRPRMQPLMNMKGESSKRYRDHGAQIFRFAMAIKNKNLVDWSTNNILAAGLADTMCICDVDFKNLSKVYRVDHTSYLCCIKWNVGGTRVSMSGIDGTTSMYDTTLTKTIWTQKCAASDVHLKSCKVTCTVWANKDQHLINACSEGCLSVINPSSGRVMKKKTFDREILAVSVSPTEQYLAVSGTDRLVKMFDYPSLVQLFEIAFFASIRAMAWHPWSSGILCIGGGPGDASLSLWNVNSQRQLAYRKVKFVGTVDALMFNRLSGELLVHWFYLDDDRLHSKVAILAGLDRIVDAVPLQPEHRMLNIIWSPDHTKLAMQHRDTLVIWNFFGNDFAKWSKGKKSCAGKDSKNNLRNYCLDTQCSSELYTGLKNARRNKEFTYYNIR